MSSNLGRRQKKCLANSADAVREQQLLQIYLCGATAEVRVVPILYLVFVFIS
jgi:hypothetical protein